MRILLVALGYRGYAPFYARSLSALGHTVTTYVGLRPRNLGTRIRRTALVRIPAVFGRERSYLWSEQSRFGAYVRRRQDRFDLVLFVNAHSLATDEVLAHIGDQGTHSGLWLLDEVDTLATDGLSFSSFDRIATFSPSDVDTLTRSTGHECAVIPQGFVPIDWSPRSQAGGALLLGAPYPRRRAAAESLIAAGCEVELVGRTWRDFDFAKDGSALVRRSGDVSLADSIAMSANARACVHAHRRADAGLSPRIFEIGGAGGLIITDNVHSPAHFEPGVEMLHWSEPDEAAEHVLRARRDPAAIRKIADAGRRRVHAEHGLDRRFAAMLTAWRLC